MARQPRSLTANLNPLALKDNELEAEVLLINQWLGANAVSSTPETNRMAEVLGSLEQESHRRHNVKAKAKDSKNPAAPTVKPPLPIVNTNDGDAIMNAMAEIKSITPSKTASGLYTIIHDGEIHEISLDTVNKIRDQAREAIKQGISKSRTQAEHAQARYQGQNEVDRRDNWNKAAAYLVKSVGAIRDPGPDLIAEVDEALSKASSAENALEHNDFSRAGLMLSRSESSAIKANMIFQAYFDNIIEAGKMTVTVLTITRDTMFSIAIGIGAALRSTNCSHLTCGIGYCRCCPRNRCHGNCRRSGCWRDLTRGYESSGTSLDRRRNQCIEDRR